ncbi:MAG: hypothetical protein ABIS03_13820 [Gemmatimonadaceae bacterium]
MPSTNSQQSRTIQEATTTASKAEVIASAKRFFGRRSGIYAAFLEKEGDGWATFRGQGGEEIVVGTAGVDGGTRVTGSTYLFDQQVARFLASLPVATGVVFAGVESTAEPGQ